MSLKDWKNRLFRMEWKRGSHDIILHFGDGSTKGVHVRDECALWSAAATRISWAIGPPEGREDHRDEGGARPVSKFDREIELFGRAERCESDDPFLQSVFEACKEALAENV